MLLIVLIIGIVLGLIGLGLLIGGIVKYNSDAANKTSTPPGKISGTTWALIGVGVGFLVIGIIVALLGVFMK